MYIFIFVLEFLFKLKEQNHASSINTCMYLGAKYWLLSKHDNCRYLHTKIISTLFYIVDNFFIWWDEIHEIEQMYQDITYFIKKIIYDFI